MLRILRQDLWGKIAYKLLRGVKESISARFARGFHVVEDDNTSKAPDLAATVDEHLSSG